MNTRRCEIDFYVDFEFKSWVRQRVIELFFNEAVRRMVTAFETRAYDLYDQLPADGTETGRA